MDRVQRATNECPGRKVQTPSGKRADILAIDTTGELFVIELKKDRTPRDVGIGEVKGDRVKLLTSRSSSMVSSCRSLRYLD